MTDVKSYLTQVQMHLTLRGLSPAQISQTLAEVRSYVEESGEDPMAAFGTPEQFAAEFTSGPTRSGWRTAMAALTLAALVLVVVAAAVNGFQGAPSRPVQILAILGLTAVISAAILLAFAAASAHLDGRSPTVPWQRTRPSTVATHPAAAARTTRANALASGRQAAARAPSSDLTRA